MAPTGLLAVPLPCNPVWNMGETLYAVRAGSWGGASRYSSVHRRPCFFPSRFRGRMQDSYLPRDLCGTRPSSQKRRGDHILRFCRVARWVRKSSILRFRCVARRVRRSQGEVRRQSLEEIEVLEEVNSKDKVFLGVRHGDAERRPLHVYTQGIPTLSSPSVHAGLVRDPLRRQVLSMCCTALRLGAVTSTVYNADGHLRGRPKMMGLSHTGISRRLSTSPCFTRGGKYKGSLCYRCRPRRQVDEESRSHKASKQRRLDRENSDLAPWS